MSNQQSQPLRVLEWLETPRFSYMFSWPYAEQLNPDNAELDVRVRPNEEKYKGRTFIGTFITPKSLLERFEEFETIGFFANGTYVPLSNELLVKQISEPTLVKTIDDFLTDNSFEEHFKEESPEGE